MKKELIALDSLDGGTIHQDLLFGLDQRPPWPRALAYAFQWLIIFLPTLMILSAICSEYLRLQEAEKMLFFQRVLLTTGGIMILQTLWGHRYPLLDGPSSALLLTLLVLAPGGMPAISVPPYRLPQAGPSSPFWASFGSCGMWKPSSRTTWSG